MYNALSLFHSLFLFPMHILSHDLRPQGSVDHCVVGVEILYHLVMEMNLADSMRSVSKHRKVASSFRDESLFDIFTLSCTLLQQINVHDKTQVIMSMTCYCHMFNTCCPW